MLSHQTTTNMKLLVFQYNILINVLYLNKMLFRLGEIKSSLCSFCKSSDETVVQLFSSCSLYQNIWSQTQIFFSNYFTIISIFWQSAILCFMEEIQVQNDIILNHILLIYKQCVSVKKLSKFKLNWSQKLYYKNKNFIFYFCSFYFVFSFTSIIRCWV